MVNRLQLLRAEDADQAMGEAMTGKSIGGPAMTLVGKPKEEFNSKWYPVLPNKAPIGGNCAAREKSLVAGARRLNSTVRHFQLIKSGFVISATV